ncbi:hypothetical protein ACOME3_007336 [Neoechinorhynchus agilis]
MQNVKISCFYRLSISDCNIMTSKSRCVPLILRMTWSGYPLHHDRKLGWGYIVPNVSMVHDQDDLVLNIIRAVQGNGKFEEVRRKLLDENTYQDQIVTSLNSKPFNTQDNGDSHREIWKSFCETRMRPISQQDTCLYHGSNDSDYLLPIDGPYPYVNFLPKNCWFFRIPHADKLRSNVGNPLSKSFARYASQPFSKNCETAALRSGWPNEEFCLKDLIEHAKTVSYWENTIHRLISQMVIGKDGEDSYIIPRVIVSGTITRRAVERTWLTASNPKPSVIGSELKAIVQANHDQCFVGADVDSQEMWIATLFGDKYFSGVHGSTASSWMLLQGNHTLGTDLHSSVANTIGVIRDQAKVLNYARIYGAGSRFAGQLLSSFNPSMPRDECGLKIKKMYEMTKGIRRNGKWSGGSESALFNFLEEVAMSDIPRTPVLKSQISRSLEPRNVNDDFLTSRINWVVQSSAVDYLHLLLVNMKWLCCKYEINARLTLSIHDEVRYLILDETDKYRAALALQISNMMTRAFFCYRIGMELDLPSSVAFFSEIEIDKCLRKSCDDQCMTPSNPMGMKATYGIQNGQRLNIYELCNFISGLSKNQE